MSIHLLISCQTDKRDIFKGRKMDLLYIRRIIGAVPQKNQDKNNLFLVYNGILIDKNCERIARKLFCPD